MTYISFRQVNKRYDNGTIAVDDFHLDIERGEFIVLAGPSGCEKTTLLRMVSGLETITSGDIDIDGNRINDIPVKDRDIAMVFQNYALYPHKSVYENIAFHMRIQKLSKQEIDRRVKDVSQILKIDDLLANKPNTLSGGQQQRVALARAIARDPKVFLFDEPLSNLDAQLRAGLRTEIRRIHQNLKKNVIYVTHDQTEAMTTGDRIVVMNDGAIQQVGTPHELYHTPRNRFVAGFIGIPSMNFFQGTTEMENNNLYFVCNTFRLKLHSSLSEKIDIETQQPIILGIRPEHILEKQSIPNPDREPIVIAQVERIETIGSESYIYLKSGSFSIVMKQSAGRILSRTQDIEIIIQTEKAILFHAETGECIS